jgi:Protein of unknown function (DUF4038)/Putative collagen-binding domain of a collagenase
VRVSPSETGVARVSASVDAMTAGALRRGPSAGDWAGAIAVKPGAHSVRIEVFDAAGARLGETALAITAARGVPAAVDATVAAGAEGFERPLVTALVAPRNSAVVGERMLLQGRAGRARATLAWTAAPAGCGIFASPRAGSTEWTASAPGPCKVTLAATEEGQTDRRSVQIVVRSHGRVYQYPLRVAAGGRHLVDQRGRPFLIKGETAWLALVNLTEAEQERYLADRSAKGFNVVEVMLTNHDYTSTPNPTPPANRAGEQPFLKPGDFSTPNDAYFDRAEAFVDRAAAHGIVVLMAANYLGFDGGREGWWETLTAPANTRAVSAAFGRYLGARFKAKKNLLWLAGGDFAPPPGSEGEARHWEILNGIREAGAWQPWTGHWNFDHLGGISTDEARFREAMALNGVYQYAKPYRAAARAYGVQPPRPVFLLESTYEHEHPGSDTQPFRKAWWWTMVAGGSGVLSSNAFLWLCESARATYRIDYGDVDHAVSSWTAELESPGTYQALHLHALFEMLPWYRLVPAGGSSRGPPLIVSGQGWGQKHIAAAATPEGDLFLAYVPPTGTAARSLAIDLSRMRGPGVARWYDPSTGGWFPIPGSLLDSAHVDLETPGANWTGANDWVLVVEARAAGNSGGR